MSTPSHYNAIKLDTIKTRTPMYSQKSTVVRFKPLKTTLPSPTSYDKNDMRLSYRQSIPNVTFTKEIGKNYMDRHLKAKTFVPSPNSYDISRA